MHDAELHPTTLRRYALLADGERGALVDPHGAIAFMCAPRWHDDAVFSGLLGGAGCYAVTPADRHRVWGGHYEPGSLIWRNRWVTTRSIIECREALAFPGDPDRLVLLRRVEAVQGEAQVHVELECRAEFGARVMTVGRSPDGVWQGRSGTLHYRWSGAPLRTRVRDGRLCVDLAVPEGEHLDLVLELTPGRLPSAPPDPDAAWSATEQAWDRARPDVSGSAAPGDSVHSWAVLRGLTCADGGMAAAATTSLPERADTGRDYDYRYAWIRDQCFAGHAALASGAHDLLDAAVDFVSDRVLSDGDALRPVYRVDGGAVPAQRPLDLPGYPGAPVRVGNHARGQFQLDVFGEVMLLLAGAERVGRLGAAGERALEALGAYIESQARRAGAGIWELDERHWAHSRLMCVAGLRAAAASRRDLARSACTRGLVAGWERLADRILEDVDRDCLHGSGRWQRSPDDEAVDAALLLPGIRGAVSPEDPRNLRSVAAVRDELGDDGYVYRFRHRPDQPLHVAEGAFVLCGFHMSLARLRQGHGAEALRWFERNRAVLGPPGLFAEEFDVVQRQLRGNLPQAFVHAAALETAHELGGSGLATSGFTVDDR